MNKFRLTQTANEVQSILNRIGTLNVTEVVNRLYYPPFLGKKISILGDSISTFSGYIPSGNATWYPRGEVTAVTDTWWYQLIQQQGSTLGVNES